MHTWQQPGRLQPVTHVAIIKVSINIHIQAFIAASCLTINQRRSAHLSVLMLL